MIYNINKFSNKKFKFDLTNQELLRLPNVNPNKILEKKVELITFDLNNVCMNGMNSLLHHKGKEIGTVQLCNILGSNIGEAILSAENGNIKQINVGEIFGAKLIMAPENSPDIKISGTYIK